MLMTINDTQATALGILHAGPMNGGQVFARVEDMSPFWNITRSQVYRELPKLVEDGLAKASEPGARNAVNYAITAAGRKAFAAWLAEEGKVIVRDGSKARSYLRDFVAKTGSAVPIRKKTSKRAKPTTEDAPAPKKRVRKKAAAPVATDE